MVDFPAADVGNFLSLRQQVAPIPHGLLHPLALGDVEENADGATRATLRIEQRPRLAQGGADGAVGEKQIEFVAGDNHSARRALHGQIVRRDLPAILESPEVDRGIPHPR